MALYLAHTFFSLYALFEYSNCLYSIYTNAFLPKVLLSLKLTISNKCITNLIFYFNSTICSHIYRNYYCLVVLYLFIHWEILSISLGFCDSQQWQVSPYANIFTEWELFGWYFVQCDYCLSHNLKECKENGDINPRWSHETRTHTVHAHRVKTLYSWLD